MGKSSRSSRSRLFSYPFIIWGFLAAALHAYIVVSNLSYDDGGLGTALILSSPIWGPMYWLTNEVVFTVDAEVSTHTRRIVVLLSGLALCFIADVLLHRARRWRGSSRAARHEVEKG